jgi:hypothetical protein
VSTEKEEEHHNPLFNNTTQSFAPAPGWTTPTIAPEEKKPAQPPPVAEIPPVVTVQSIDLPPAGQARRTNRKMRFTDLYETRSLSIDKRLLPYFDNLMENGPNKTVVANQWVLKVLLEAGYKIDPQILTKTVIKPD